MSAYDLSQCEYCNASFRPVRGKKFCSSSCKQKAYYIRNGLRKDTRSNEVFSSEIGVIESQKDILMNNNTSSKKSSKYNKTDIENNQERKIKELEKRLEHISLKALAFEEMILIAEQHYNIPIRKKSGAKQ